MPKPVPMDSRALPAMKTILVVDDSRPIRQLLRICLAGAGFRVIEAENGVDGLSAARTAHVDLVIADVNMPAMNGLEMIRQLRGTNGYARTPMFVLTTESGARVAEGRAAGATAWIVKPFKPEALLAGVKRVLG